ncbi:pyridoxal phosphate-dependent aminotransferase [Lactobacillus sp. LC28-10]|uniref:cysteine-S-conjugate beta-lyase n=1 Tax=Secundilactobacillus angelensis TaxID=2722706 RepID=A0ABX1KXE2_9LACO|nr:MalY/PatB family protein [Secundilactobacillus angelensis]MCH5461607.1 pyridoxal phosphate-dependent aminotransferase [Secundilactobacillus angelensis]NLR17902.1 pyridoxal phosphate-dependent aminotransferase [Secundilactobacillus angelensis]
MTNFSELIDRRHTNSVKWDVKDNELPMWVADMDFRTLPAIVSAIQEKADNGIFGYEEVPQAYFDAVQSWYEQEHDWRPETDWMIFATGVVPTISSSVRRLTNVGDNVLIQAPVYNIFYNSILNNGRHVLSSDLVLDDQDTYHIDWEDLEAKMAEPLTTMMILCNPHNPVGMIWSAEALARIGELAAKHHVVVLSDEIHGDITAPDKGYVPFASVNQTNAQNSVTTVSPSKTFNVAALHAATVIIPNEALRAVVNRGLNTDELAEPNSFAVPATIAAYTQGHQWVHELRAYVEDNKQTVAKFVAESIPGVKTVAGDATYLIWLDTSEVGMPSDKLEQFIRKETGLYLSDGTVYGGDGREFLRMNVACPKERLMDGLNRLKQGIAAVK